MTFSEVHFFKIVALSFQDVAIMAMAVPSLPSFFIVTFSSQLGVCSRVLPIYLISCWQFPLEFGLGSSQLILFWSFLCWISFHVAFSPLISLNLLIFALPVLPCNLTSLHLFGIQLERLSWQAIRHHKTAAVICPLSISISLSNLNISHHKLPFMVFHSSIRISSKFDLTPGKDPAAMHAAGFSMRCVPSKAPNQAFCITVLWSLVFLWTQPGAFSTIFIVFTCFHRVAFPSGVSDSDLFALSQVLVPRGNTLTLGHVVPKRWILYAA